MYMSSVFLIHIEYTYRVCFWYILSTHIECVLHTCWVHICHAALSIYQQQHRPQSSQYISSVLSICIKHTLEMCTQYRYMFLIHIDMCCSYISKCVLNIDICSWYILICVVHTYRNVYSISISVLDTYWVPLSNRYAYMRVCRGEAYAYMRVCVYLYVYIYIFIYTYAYMRVCRGEAQRWIATRVPWNRPIKRPMKRDLYKRPIWGCSLNVY